MSLLIVRSQFRLLIVKIAIIVSKVILALWRCLKTLSGHLKTWKFSSKFRGRKIIWRNLQCVKEVVRPLLNRNYNTSETSLADFERKEGLLNMFVSLVVLVIHKSDEVCMMLSCHYVLLFVATWRRTVLWQLQRNFLKVPAKKVPLAVDQTARGNIWNFMRKSKSFNGYVTLPDWEDLSSLIWSSSSSSP